MSNGNQVSDDGGVATTDQNDDGQGGNDKSGGGGIVGVLIGAAVTLAADALKALASSLTGDRSVIVSISNNTDLTLTLKETHHDHGDFASQPPQTIGPRTAAGFSSENHGLVGTQGAVTYDSTDGGASFVFGWDNPRVGSNSASASKTGPQKSRLLVGFSAGSGNSSAPMHYWLFVHPEYSVRKSLAEKGDLSQGLRRLGGTSPISVRDLVDF